MIPSSNRRSFLQHTAAAASTLILPSGLLRGQAARKLNIGFIGMGGQIQGHVSKIVQLGHHGLLAKNNGGGGNCHNSAHQ